LAQERQRELSNRETPPNYAKREAELSAQLNVLATKLKTSEDSEDFDSGSKELEEKQALIQSTKYEHLDILKDELAELRRQREALEKTSDQKR
jgi:hypothetical protein